MKFINNSKHFVRGLIYGGFPRTQGNRAGSFGDVAPGGDSESPQLNPGDYYVVLETTNIGPITPGLVIAASGGVPSEGTVILTDSDRIGIQ